MLPISIRQIARQTHSARANGMFFLTLHAATQASQQHQHQQKNHAPNGKRGF